MLKLSWLSKFTHEWRNTIGLFAGLPALRDRIGNSPCLPFLFGCGLSLAGLPVDHLVYVHNSHNVEH